MLGKKGAGFWLLIYSISLFGVLSGLYLLSLDEANEFNLYQKLFGKLQKEIPLFYNNIDVEMEISRQEVRYHVFEVTNEFGENGGFAKENLCDKREGFVVIDFKICNPDLEANYLELFKREFKAVNINFVGPDECVKDAKKGEHYKALLGIDDLKRIDIGFVLLFSLFFLSLISFV